ncbi:MAG: YlmC/YmxH family sporulation protein [Clostridia bacterium]|nr:YlmC/YmxH family sporulation protein [Clostridia bacterium]MBQ6895101.1 YlmC/YmxH family sporulation protein [Clostridia bacterium]
MPSCSINEIRNKEIINIKTGVRLGFPSDIEIDLETGKFVSIVVSGGYKIMGLFGRENDIIIKWENIKNIGDDLIIVEME